MTQQFAALYAPGNLPVLLDCAARFSPLVEVTSPDLITIDLRGVERFFGSPDRIALELQRTVGIPARIALASNPDTAIYLSRGGTAEIMIAPPGDEARLLAPLSLHLLGCPSDLGALLDGWGLRTFGQFAELPSLGIRERCGQEGSYWQQQAKGAIQRQLRLRGEPLRLVKEAEWDDPICTQEPLLFALGKLLFEVCLELTARSLATNEIRVLLRLEKAADHQLTVRLPVALADRKTLLKLLGHELEQRTASAPVCAMKLELVPASLPATQEHLFTAAYPYPDQLELTVARVRRLVGADRVGAAALLDTHKPDAYVMRPFCPLPREPEEYKVGPLPLAFRRFRPPVPAEVQLAQQPTHVKAANIAGSVRLSRGPWFSSGHWWLADAWQREEWDVGLQNGAVYKIFRDLESDSWFVEGYYD